MNKYDKILESINALANGKQPSLDISELLYQHKCFYLLNKINRDNEYVQMMNNDMKRDSIYIQESYKECENIFKILEENSIQYAIIKGAVLSKAAYEGPFCRYTKDIDILVNKDDVDIVKKILYDNGFIQARITKNGIKSLTRKEILFQSIFSHQVASFIKETENPYFSYINIDLNTDIMWGESDEKIDVRFVLDGTLSTTICGIEVRKLYPEIEFISLCLHHYKDMNSIYLLSQGSLRLKLFLDIYMYIINGGMNSQLLLSICKKLNVTKYIYYCLYYTKMIFENDKLEKYCYDFKTVECEQLIERYGLSENEFAVWKVDFYKRLFDLDIREYFKDNLPMKLRDKIALNELYM